MKSFQFQYQEFLFDQDVPSNFLDLLKVARETTQNAYAPYSNFLVGAAVLLQNGKVVTGVNIENASYPVGICAERSALASAISQFPHEKIESIAISYQTSNGENNKPAFPCGMCRQFISECEDRNQGVINLILGAQKGVIIVVNSAKHLLPFSFGGNDLG